MIFKRNIICSFILVFFLTLIQVGAKVSFAMEEKSSRAEDDIEVEQMTFDNCELLILGDEVPVEFNSLTYNEVKTLGEKLALKKEAFTSNEASFIFYSYDTGERLYLNYGVDKLEGRQFFNLAFKEKTEGILNNDAFKDIYPTSYDYFSKEYKVDKKLIGDNFNKALKDIKDKKSGSYKYTDKNYEVTILATYKEKGSEILVSFEDKGKEGFNLDKILNHMEKLYGPITTAKAYYRFTADNRDPLEVEYNIAEEREWEEIRVREILNVRRDNESVSYISSYIDTKEDLVEYMENIENNFVTFANSVATVPLVREYGPYKLQIEQGLKDRNKISFILENQKYFSDYIKEDGEN